MDAWTHRRLERVKHMMAHQLAARHDEMEARRQRWQRWCVR
jgi:hypothetical protein